MGWAGDREKTESGPILGAWAESVVYVDLHVCLLLLVKSNEPITVAPVIEKSALKWPSCYTIL